jgi:hypothetical protein
MAVNHYGPQFSRILTPTFSRSAAPVESTIRDLQALDPCVAGIDKDLALPPGRPRGELF